MIRYYALPRCLRAKFEGSQSPRHVTLGHVKPLIPTQLPKGPGPSVRCGCVAFDHSLEALQGLLTPSSKRVYLGTHPRRRCGSRKNTCRAILGTRGTHPRPPPIPPASRLRKRYAILRLGKGFFPHSAIRGLGLPRWKDTDHGLG